MKHNNSGGMFFKVVMLGIFILVIIATGSGPRFLEITFGLIKFAIIIIVGYLIIMMSKG